MTVLRAVIKFVKTTQRFLPLALIEDEVDRDPARGTQGGGARAGEGVV